ncbi:MAG TPA: hypothetical protein VGB78_08915 [Thermoplasmata archaeon]
MKKGKAILVVLKDAPLIVHDQRKGTYFARAGSDFVFDSESMESYDVILDQKELRGMNTTWYEGDRIPCINGLAIIEFRGG